MGVYSVPSDLAAVSDRWLDTVVWSSRCDGCNVLHKAPEGATVRSATALGAAMAARHDSWGAAIVGGLDVSEEERARGVRVVPLSVGRIVCPTCRG